MRELGNLAVSKAKFNMLKILFYLLLTISIVPRYLNCYVVSDDATIKTGISIISDDKDTEHPTSSNIDVANNSTTNDTTDAKDTTAFELNDAVEYATKTADGISGGVSGKSTVFFSLVSCVLFMKLIVIAILLLQIEANLNGKSILTIHQFATRFGKQTNCVEAKALWKIPK